MFRKAFREVRELAALFGEIAVAILETLFSPEAIQGYIIAFLIFVTIYFFFH